MEETGVGIYKVTEKEYELDEARNHLGLFLALFVGPHEQVVPSKSSRFMDIGEGRVDA